MFTSNETVAPFVVSWIVLINQGVSSERFSPHPLKSITLLITNHQTVKTCIFLSLIKPRRTYNVLDSWAYRFCGQGEQAAPGAPWPLPRTWTKSTTRLMVDPTNFRFTSSMTYCDIVTSAFDRYYRILQLEKTSSLSGPEQVMTSLSVDIADKTCPGYPDPNMNESCE